MTATRALLFPKLYGTRSVIFPSTIVAGEVNYVVWTRSFASLRSQTVRRRRLQAAKSYKKPTLELAKAMPLSHQEMDNQTLVTLGEMGNHKARKEILIRHIMVKENAVYDDAYEKYKLVAAKNRENMFLLAIPYKIGIGVALTAGFSSLPMVFSLSTAEWFNHLYVTTDVPEPADLETMLEVGSWTWNWMEPPLGTISFFLLTLQFSRAQLHNLGIKPYTQRIKRWRGERLAAAFPEYDSRLLIEYSESSCIQASQKEVVDEVSCNKK